MSESSVRGWFAVVCAGQVWFAKSSWPGACPYPATKRRQETDVVRRVSETLPSHSLPVIQRLSFNAQGSAKFWLSTLDSRLSTPLDS